MQRAERTVDRGHLDDALGRIALARDSCGADDGRSLFARPTHEGIDNQGGNAKGRDVGRDPAELRPDHAEIERADGQVDLRDPSVVAIDIDCRVLGPGPTGAPPLVEPAWDVVSHSIAACVVEGLNGRERRLDGTGRATAKDHGREGNHQGRRIGRVTTINIGE